MTNSRPAPPAMAHAQAEELRMQRARYRPGRAGARCRRTARM